MTSLKSKLTKLAYENPDMREALLPLLTEGSASTKRRAGRVATVDMFLLALSGHLTQYDLKQSLKGRGYNPNALALYMGALDKVRTDTKRYHKRDDLEAMGALKASMARRFNDFPPVRAVSRKIDAWLQKGKMPKYPMSPSLNRTAKAGDPLEQAKMWAKGYRYIIRFSNQAKKTPLYAKDSRGVAKLMREDFPKEKGWKAEKLKDPKTDS